MYHKEKQQLASIEIKGNISGNISLEIRNFHKYRKTSTFRYNNNVKPFSKILRCKKLCTG